MKTTEFENNYEDLSQHVEIQMVDTKTTLFRSITDWVERSKSRERLVKLNPRMLKDIGLSRMPI